MPESVTYVPGMVCNLCARKHKLVHSSKSRRGVIFLVRWVSDGVLHHWLTRSEIALHVTNFYRFNYRP